MPFLENGPPRQCRERKGWHVRVVQPCVCCRSGLTSALSWPREALTKRRGRDSVPRARGAPLPSFRGLLERIVRCHDGYQTCSFQGREGRSRYLPVQEFGRKTANIRAATVQAAKNPIRPRVSTGATSSHPPRNATPLEARPLRIAITKITDDFG